MDKGVEAVDRALTILSALQAQQRLLTLHELAQVTGYYKSTILRLVASLEKFGYLRRQKDGRYQLGPACAQLALAHGATVSLKDVLQPAIRDLAETCHETVSFYIRDGKNRVCQFRQNSQRAIRHHVDEGDRLPLDRGAAGLVLLAFDGRTGKRFDQIRREGYAVTLGERDPDAAAISAPVFDASDELIGALTISGLRSRFTADAIRQLTKALLRTVSKLEAELGYTANKESQLQDRASRQRAE